MMEDWINIAGTTTTVKAYHKGAEFLHHDYKRIYKHCSREKADELYQIANRLVRFEVEIKRKLKDRNGKYPAIDHVDIHALADIYHMEVMKLVRDSASETKICRTSEAVERRLNQMYSTQLASRLLGTWYRLSVHDEEYIKKSMPRATFYRQRKMLIEAGVSWKGTDVVLKNFSLIPSGFTPVATDSRCLKDVDPIMTEALKTVI